MINSFLVVTLLASTLARASCSEPPPPLNGTPNAAGNETASARPNEGDAGEPASSVAPHGHRAVPDEIAARHILVMYRGSQRAPGDITRSRDEAQARAMAARRRAVAGEDFAALVREYSDEPGAAARGGSLSRFGHGEMVPAFERAAFALEVGQISEIVETPFGFHVIQRTE